jgi:hypothetical protein
VFTPFHGLTNCTLFGNKYIVACFNYRLRAPYVSVADITCVEISRLNCRLRKLTFAILHQSCSRSACRSCHSHTSVQKSVRPRAKTTRALYRNIYGTCWCAFSLTCASKRWVRRTKHVHRGREASVKRHEVSRSHTIHISSSAFQ